MSADDDIIGQRSPGSAKQGERRIPLGDMLKWW